MKNYIATLSLVLASTCAVPVKAIDFTENFESGTLDPQYWQAVPGAPNGVVEASAVDGVAHGGIYGVRLGKSSDDGDDVTNALDLHLNLAGEEQVELSFWIKSNGDDTNTGDGIWFSSDGGLTFTHVYSFDPSSWTQAVYGQLPPLDVDKLARENGLALSENFVIRFQQQGVTELNRSFSRDGLYLDDITVRTVPESYVENLPFAEGFENGVLASVWHWGDPSLTNPPGVSLPGGWVGVVSNDQSNHEGIYGAVLGRRVDGNATTNALDLRVNLANYQQVQLSFWLFRNGDEINPQGDGVWFSDDGGETFRHVYTYDVLDRQYQQISLDVDALAQGAGLALNDRFVMRFQQLGEQEINRNSNPDGYYLDDVAVTGTFVPPGTCNGLTATIVGTEGDDILAGTDGNDVVMGLGGRDIIVLAGGDDTVCAGKGADYVTGGSGNDTIFGGPGDDILLGGDGDDQVRGEEGDDFMSGDAGNDVLDEVGNDLRFDE